MADTLVREAIAYGSQPLSPVSQYWDGASYAKVQGINGSIRIINYNSAGETFTNAIPGTVQLVTSAGATNLFSGSNPGSVQLTATSTMAISGTATVNFSASGSVDILTMPVVGSANNTWSSGATITSGATSTVVDLRYNYNISYFGTVTNTASITLNLLVSQDDSTYYTAATATITAGTSSDFHYSTTSAARYAKLMITGVSATITATIAGK
jgi:hypothetical protein